MNKRNFKKIRIFQLTKDKKVKLHFKGPFIANANCFGIQIDEYFDRFTKNEQKSIIWHEYYHYKIFWRRLFLMLKDFFSKYNAKQLEEFEADEYAAIKFDKESTLSYLRKVKKMQDNEEIPIDLKYHPPIKERIKRIENLKLK